MSPSLGFPSSLALTMLLIGAVFMTGLRGRLRLHIPLVVATLVSLGVTIYFAEKLGEGYDLEAAGLITPIHLTIAKITTAAYLFPIVFRAFVLAPDTVSDVHEVGEASRLMVVPLMITGVLALVLGVFPDLGFSFLQLATAVALAVTGSNP